MGKKYSKDSDPLENVYPSSLKINEEHPKSRVLKIESDAESDEEEGESYEEEGNINFADLLQVDFNFNKEIEGVLNLLNSDNNETLRNDGSEYLSSFEDDNTNKKNIKNVNSSDNLLIDKISSKTYMKIPSENKLGRVFEKKVKEENKKVGNSYDCIFFYLLPLELIYSIFLFLNEWDILSISDFSDSLFSELCLNNNFWKVYFQFHSNYNNRSNFFSHKVNYLDKIISRNKSYKKIVKAVCKLRINSIFKLSNFFISCQLKKKFDWKAFDVIRIRFKIRNCIYGYGIEGKHVKKTKKDLELCKKVKIKEVVIDYIQLVEECSANIGKFRYNKKYMINHAINEGSIKKRSKTQIRFDETDIISNYRLPEVLPKRMGKAIDKKYDEIKELFLNRNECTVVSKEKLEKWRFYYENFLGCDICFDDSKNSNNKKYGIKNEDQYSICLSHPVRFYNSNKVFYFFEKTQLDDISLAITKKDFHDVTKKEKLKILKQYQNELKGGMEKEKNKNKTKIFKITTPIVGITNGLKTKKKKIHPNMQLKDSDQDCHYSHPYQYYRKIDKLSKIYEEDDDEEQIIYDHDFNFHMYFKNEMEKVIRTYFHRRKFGGGTKVFHNLLNLIENKVKKSRFTTARIKKRINVRTASSFLLFNKIPAKDRNKHYQKLLNPDESFM